MQRQGPEVPTQSYLNFSFGCEIDEVVELGGRTLIFYVIPSLLHSLQRQGKFLLNVKYIQEVILLVFVTILYLPMSHLEQHVLKFQGII